MADQVYRVLALGEGAVLDRLAASLTAAGYAVAQVDGRQQARRLLKDGAFDVVVADGEARAVAELLSAQGSRRPWILLGKADGPLATPAHALWLTPSVSGQELCRQIEAVVTRSREVEAPAGRRPKEKAAAGSARPSRSAT